MRVRLASKKKASRLTALLLYAVVALTALLAARSAGAAAATDLAIRVTATSFQVGRDGVYNITVTNNGPAATDADVDVTGTLPDGLSFVSARGTGWSCSASGRSFDCQNPTPLTVGKSSLLTFTVGVCSAAFPTITNSFTLVYPADANAANNTATRTTVVKSGQCTPFTATPTRTGTIFPTTTVTPTRTPTPVPAVTDLSISKNTAGTFKVGINGVYNLVVRNIGAATTNSEITVADVLPAGLGFVSGTGTGWSCSASGQTVMCTTAVPLAAGASTAITLTVSVARAAYPTVTNTATLAYVGDSNPANNTSRRPTSVRLLAHLPATATATAGGPTGTPTRTPTPTPGNVASTDLALTMSAGGRFTVGLTGTYFLTVRNAGNATTNAAITVVDTMPSGLSFVSGSGAGTCSASGQAAICTDPKPLAPGAGITFTLTVAVSEAAYPTVTNSATVSYAGDTNVTNNTATRPTTIQGGSTTARHTVRTSAPRR
jgi:uncharacterized repeat protein (TIGR01451 family)